MSNELKAKLYSKVVAISEELGRVEQDSKNTHSGYSYISYEHLHARLRSLLPKHKLAIVPSVLECNERDFPGEKHVMIRSVVKASFMLVDLETGYSEERLCWGAGSDTQGKALGVAVTEAQKRFELKLLHVSSKDDLQDGDSKDTPIPTPKDPIEFIRAHPDLVELCKGMMLKKEEIISIVTNEKYDPTKVKAALESAKGF